MMEWLKDNWGWLAGFASTVGTGLLYLLGLKARVEALEVKQVGDNGHRIADIQRLEAAQRVTNAKVEDLAAQIEADVRTLMAGQARIEAQNAMMISILNAKK